MQSAKVQRRSHTGKCKILVVDDHPIIREGMTMLINRESDLEVCANAEEAHAALLAIETQSPDLVLLDISLNGPDGLDLLKSIRSRNADLPVLMLSMHDEMQYADRALRAGANGYIMKQEATDKVLIAIRRILGGEVYVSERVANRMLQNMVGRSKLAEGSPLAALSDRELEVFRMIGEGRGTRQIAEELNLSIKTVETYEAHLKDKLGLRSARELVQYAIEWALTRDS